jgi:hypothetical protein
LEAKQEGIEIKKYHADNGIFASKAFKEECDLKGQGYCLVELKHTTKMEWLSGISRQLQIGCKPTCFIWLITGLNTQIFASGLKQ